MSRKSRTVAGILAATVLTGAGVATMANAVATAQPAAPAVSVETPAASPTELPASQQRTDELARSVDGLVAQIGVLEQAVAAGTPTPSSTPLSGQARSAVSHAVEPEPEHTTAPPQVGTAPTDDHSESSGSESHETEEPSDD